MRTAFLKNAWSLLKETGEEWLEDNASRLAAALAYYTLLSIAPLLVIAVAVAGLFFGAEAARGEIARELSKLVGSHAAETIQTILQKAEAPATGVVSSIIGVAVLLVGASGVFGELQSALNTIWNVPPRPSTRILDVLKDRFFSFAMVLGVAFLLLVSLLLSAGIAATGQLLSAWLPGGEFVWQMVNFLISFGVVTGLFALIFKILPDARVAWRDVWVGAAFTAFLFTVGKSLLGLYLGKSMVSSPYGAAGSTVVFVVWVYYSAQILFLGAEFTQVYARHVGSLIVPDSHERVPRASQPSPPAPANV